VPEKLVKMPLERARSTLSMMQRKATKYQKYLNLSNVFLLITSTILIFTAVVLMKFYHVDKLDFWSIYFWLVPIYMICLGVFTFLVCIFGFVISQSENRALIAGFAVLLAIAFLAQLGSIFTALELRTVVGQSNVGASAVNDDLKWYGKDPAITAKWDELQRDLHCCGGNHFLIGYNDYRNTAIGANNSVPDSCCHTMTKDCGKDMLTRRPEEIQNAIFINGCLEILSDKLDNDVIPMMVVYAVVGVILALTELITVVLACAYVAQITRRINRANEYANTMDRMAYDETDKLNHETPC